MAQVISIGNQRFDTIRERNCFWVDKSHFIKEWWESEDSITLITRPRRFGKTLNMSMLECFFSNKYSDRGDLFEGLSIWKDEKYRKLQGTYPVIFLSFAAVKADNLKDSKQQIKQQIVTLYRDNQYLVEGTCLSREEKEEYQKISVEMDDAWASASLNVLCQYFHRYYGKKAIVLLDEYDTPMQEAYIHGYWKEFTAFIRSLFNATFKTNPYLERAIMTGITRVSKESIFSDLNNLNVVTTTSEEYADVFGFTEEEVFDALEKFDMGDKKEEVKLWYDGFVFGTHHDIYNPWSITNYLDKGKFRNYWAATSSNGLVGRLIQTASADVKRMMEALMTGEMIHVSFDEQIIYNQLDTDENAIWGLLMAGGYLSAEEVDDSSGDFELVYTLRLTNRETRNMFSGMFKQWFRISGGSYNEFIGAFQKGDIEAMNFYMNKLTMATFSYFDVGNGDVNSQEPEKFYHGFVLGLMAQMSEHYQVRSNRESGFGRYDIMMIPRNPQGEYPGIIIEFKVKSRTKPETLEEAVEAALKQIEEKNYDAELEEIGIAKESIRHYGFAFEGKKVLIGER